MRLLSPEAGLRWVARQLATLVALGTLTCTPAAQPAAPAPAAPPVAMPDSAPASPPEPELAACPRAHSLDQSAVAEEITCLLSRYVNLDTTNPPGNEARAARFIQEVLAREGIESEVAESAPGRANLMARLRGRSSEGALMLMHHMDIVPASAAEWSFPPLSGEVRDGYLWGRGSLDNKGSGVVHLLALMLIKRLELPLERDLVLLAVADEESGGAQGARWLVERRREWFTGVEYVLNEGGGILDFGGGRSVVSVEIAQKAPLWLRVTARGVAGHGGMPGPDSAARALVRALGRVAEHRFPIVVIPEVQAMFEARAAGMPEAERAPYRELERALKKTEFQQKFMSHPGDAALVHNTLAITQLSGSDKENVISENASAVLDVRLLPGQDPVAVTEELKRVMAEPALEVEPILSWQAHASPRDTPLFAAIQRLAAARHPGTPVTAQVIGGFTDCNAFRAVDMVCYGFLPARIEFEDIKRIHGKDERVSIEALARAVPDLHALLVELHQSN